MKILLVLFILNHQAESLKVEPAAFFNTLQECREAQAELTKAITKKPPQAPLAYHAKCVIIDSGESP
jgi:hypothetical protein